MLCAPVFTSAVIFVSVVSCFVRFLVKKMAALNMSSSDSQINKTQRGRSKRAELPDVNINTGVH